MRTYFFKLYFGYGADDYYPITHEELPKSIYAFLNKESNLVVNSGALRGKMILRIAPDWNAELGINPTHRMEADDYNRINSVKKHYDKCYTTAKDYVSYLLKEKKNIELNLPFSELREKYSNILENKNPKFLGSENLTAKMSLNSKD